MPLGQQNRNSGRGQQNSKKKNSPEGFPALPEFDLGRINWRAAFTGAFIDFFASQLIHGAVLSLFATVTGAQAGQSLDAVLKQFEANPSWFWSDYALGVIITLVASFIAAWIAGQWHTQHGFLSAFISQVVLSFGLGLLLGGLRLEMFDMISALIILDAGALGGWLAGVIQKSQKEKTS